MGQGLEICRMAEGLPRLGHDVVGLVTYPKEQHTADWLEHQSEEKAGLYASVFETAERLAIPLLEAAEVDDAAGVNWLAERKIDLVVSFRLRSILKEPVLELFEGRIINIHIGHLPHYRGSGAMSWMILNGERSSAVTYHLIEEEVDRGPIVHHETFEIPEGAYPIDIHRAASAAILRSYSTVVSMFATNTTNRIRQPSLAGTYFPRLDTLRDGAIDFSYKPEHFVRFTRAFGWPYAGAHCFIDGAQQVFLGRVKCDPDGRAFHPFLNGLVIATEPPVGSATVVTGGGAVVIQTVRDGVEEIPATDVLATGKRLRSAARS
jgi:methionyl-tRNA formyltransferase